MSSLPRRAAVLTSVVGLAGLAILGAGPAFAAVYPPTPSGTPTPTPTATATTGGGGAVTGVTPLITLTQSGNELTATVNNLLAGSSASITWSFSPSAVGTAFKTNVQTVAYVTGAQRPASSLGPDVRIVSAAGIVTDSQSRTALDATAAGTVTATYDGTSASGTPSTGSASLDLTAEASSSSSAAASTSAATAGGSATTGTTAAAPTSGGLAFTGANVVPLVLIGGSLVIGGGALVTTGMRRRQHGDVA